MGPHRRVGIEPLSCHKRGVFSCRGVDGRVPDGNSGSARRAYGHVAKGVDALSSNGPVSPGSVTVRQITGAGAFSRVEIALSESERTAH